MDHWCSSSNQEFLFSLFTCATSVCVGRRRQGSACKTCVACHLCASRKSVIPCFCIFNSPCYLRHGLNNRWLHFCMLSLLVLSFHETFVKRNKKGIPVFIIIPFDGCYTIITYISSTRPQTHRSSVSVFGRLHRWCTCVYVQGHITTRAPTAISDLNEPSEGAGPTSQALQYV